MQLGVQYMYMNVHVINDPFHARTCLLVFTVFSFCVVLLVSGLAEYNDSLTAAFRRIPAEGPSLVDKFAYIDSTRQTEFLLPLPPITGGACSSGRTARPVRETCVVAY